MSPLPALASLLAIVFVCAFAGSANAATFNVTMELDRNDQNLANDLCDVDTPTGCSLRAAVEQANATAGADVINVPAGVYALTAPGVEEAAVSGDLDITEGVTIAGVGARQVTVRQDVATERVFDVRPGAGSVRLQGLTIAGGEGGSGAGLRVGLNASAHVVLSAVVDNDGANGAGINTTGTLTVDRSLVARNDATSSGPGGGIFVASGDVTVVNSTLHANSGEDGAAINDGATAGSTTISYSTITGNSSPASILTRTLSTGGVISNSIVAGNTLGTGGDTCDSFASGGNNIESGTDCGFAAAGDRQNTDPRLGLLTNNGGPTDTRAPQAGSPAINNAATAGCEPVDQRGLPRPALGACDIGAVEIQPAPVTTPPRPAFLTLAPATARRRPGAENVVVATARNSDGSPSSGHLVRYAIAGPNEGTGTATTGPDGVARISWDGVRTGDDTLTAYVDANADSQHDALVEPLSRATVTWALPQPRQGRTVNVEPISGVVRYRLPAGSSRTRGKVIAAGSRRPRFQRLTTGRQLPMGTTFDTRRGRIELSSITRGIDRLQTGEFYGGVFRTRQSRRGRRVFTELRLNEGLRCVSARKALPLRASRARKRKLWGRVRRRGRFRTRGRYSTAAVRGTVWLQKDSCNTTTTVVREGVVAVRDMVKDRTVRVRAGKRYVARRASRRR